VSFRNINFTVSYLTNVIRTIYIVFQDGGIGNNKFYMFLYVW